MTPLDVACIYYNNDNEELAYQETNQVLAEHKNIGGIYINSFNSSSILRSLKENGMLGKIRIVTSDIYEELRGYLADGSVSASIFQDQYTQGRRALSSCTRALRRICPLRIPY